LLAALLESFEVLPEACFFASRLALLAETILGGYVVVVMMVRTCGGGSGREGWSFFEIYRLWDLPRGGPLSEIPPNQWRHSSPSGGLDALHCVNQQG
jgi:hypothetical protein